MDKRVVGFVTAIILVLMLLWYYGSIDLGFKPHNIKAANFALKSRSKNISGLESLIRTGISASRNLIKNKLSALEELTKNQFSALESLMKKSFSAPRGSNKKNISSLQEHCVETNICKDPSKNNSEVYYYKRTDFYEQLSLPVNYKAVINHTEPVVLRKVHFVQFSEKNKEFKFYYMIAILAASRYVQPDRIYFWHDNVPVGKYWEETKKRVKNIYLVQREKPTEIYGRPIKVIEHVSDVVRMEALLEYGGMYFDTDSIVVNPIDPLLHYDVTMGNAVSYALANGIMFSKPWSDFHKIWHKRYTTFNDKVWSAHSVLMAFKISKEYPNLIHVEPTSLCRPHFGELQWLFGPNIYDWKKKNYVVHLYMRFSEGRGISPEDIQNWNTTVGQIMRHIYYNEE